MNQYLGNYNTYQITAVNAGTEYSQVLSPRSSMVRVTSENLTTRFRVSFTENGSDTGKMVFEGSEWYSPGFIRDAKTLYVTSINDSGVVLFVEEWEAP